MKAMTNDYQMLFRKQSFGRPERRLENNIKMGVNRAVSGDMDSIEPVQG
jgi:hypothetical protein